MKRLVLIFCVSGILFFLQNWSQAEIREYLLGDIDDFTYNGTGSVDDVYVAPDFQAWGEEEFGWTLNDFDVTENNQMILFTFLYDLSESEDVIGATLTVGLRDMDPTNDANWLTLDYLDAGIRTEFSGLGWLSIPDTGTTIKMLDLSDAGNHNVLPYLQDGKLNVSIHPGMAVDHAILTVDVIPEPATFFMLAMGLITIQKRSHIIKGKIDYSTN